MNNVEIIIVFNNNIIIINLSKDTVPVLFLTCPLFSKFSLHKHGLCHVFEPNVPSKYKTFHFVVQQIQHYDIRGLYRGILVMRD